MTNKSGMAFAGLRFYARFTVSWYPYIALYCSVNPWHGAMLSMNVMWFGFIAGWEPYDQDDCDH